MERIQVHLHGTASGPPIGQPAPPLLRAPIGEDAGSEFRIEGDVVDRVALDGVERPAEYRIDGLHHTYDLDVRSFVVPPKFVVDWTRGNTHGEVSYLRRLD